ncbi:MAG: type II toxin-antitoxin system RelE/ParE family toxin [Bacteroidales bacterium]|nr:type II toxin-antitoxin system RelE/ParE family toxin [Bacteroidales bacterium]
MKYIISREAGHDLERIWFYTAENWSVDQADHYFGLIIDKIEFLSKNSDAGQDYCEIRKGYFRSKVKSQFIFYKKNSKKNVIEIIRILHQKMDIETRISE